MLGGANAVLSELKHLLPRLGSEATLLDVGTGLADIPAKARVMAARNKVRLATFGVDEAETLALVKLPEVQERLRQMGLTPAGEAAQTFAGRIAREIQMWTPIAKAANIKLD